MSRERWLLREGEPCGPHAPLGSSTREHGPRRLEAYWYRPRREPIGTYLIAPGLHFLGPGDPRLDRFCRVLSGAGFEVVAPFLPSYLELRVAADAPDDLALCAERVFERTRRRLTVFSISLGSWPAFEVAARLDHAVDGVITFGGYAEFEHAVRFCVEGVMRTPEGVRRLERDPLNSPALFLNLLPFVDGVEGDTFQLESAWREMTYRTWGKSELKAPGRLDPFARELAEHLPAAQRELFLIGCGTLPGALALVDRALARAGEQFAFASPAPALQRLRCPVVVCHGRDDDVIPWSEALELQRVLAPRVPTRLYVTGLYGHTGADRLRVLDAAREAGMLLGIARALANGGRLREWLRPDKPL